MSEQPKKQYSMEENIKYISFGIKDLVKAVQELTIAVKQVKGNKDESTW